MNYLNDQQSVTITADPNGTPEIERSLGPIINKIEELNQESMREHNSYVNEHQGQREDQMPDQPVDGRDYAWVDNLYPTEWPQSEDKKPSKKTKNKKPISATSGYANRYKEEKEKLERQFAAKEAMLQEEIRQKDIQNQYIEENYKLQLHKKELEEGISNVSEVILDSQKNQDHDSALKGTILLTKLVKNNEDVDRDLEQINSALKNNQLVNQEEEPDQVEVYLSNRFDPREAASPYFTEFLKNYPVCNPYDEEFDPDLADVIWNIRKQESSKLKISNQGDQIGSDSYFREIDARINEHYFGNEKKKQTKKSYKQAAQAAPEFDDQEYDNDQQYDDDQQYPEGEDNMNFNEKNSVNVPMQWGEHYDEGYAPTRGSKSSDYRESGTGGYVGGNGMPMGGGGQYNPNHYRGPQGQRYQAPQQQHPQGYPPQRQGQYGPPQQQSYRGGGSVQPVNRGDYRNGPNNSRVALDPVFRDQIKKMSQVMSGMCYPDGTLMNPDEREQTYIDWFSNPVNRRNI